MSFEMKLCCDGCGIALHWSRIIPKTTVIAVARKNGWSIGKNHLCDECKRKRSALKKAGWIA